MIKIASWNVNSIRARLVHSIDWLDKAEPDILLLQEIKCEEHNFPREEFELKGYNIELWGEKSYNGVAILSKYNLEDVKRGSFLSAAARYIEATVCFSDDKILQIASIYLPNGNPISGDKFTAKLAWMDRLNQYVKEKLLPREEIIVLGGDYNIISAQEDVYNDVSNWQDDALYHIESRRRYRELVNLGLTDAIRVYNKGGGVYSFWDYKAGAWQKDNGLLIDRLLLSPVAADLLISAGIDKEVRGEKKASDHAPIYCQLDL